MKRNIFLIVAVAFLLCACGAKKTMIGKVEMQGYLNPFVPNIKEGCFVNTDENVTKITYKNGECSAELGSGVAETGSVITEIE